MIDGILWRYRAGTPWRALPEEFGPWKTVYYRISFFAILHGPISGNALSL